MPTEPEKREPLLERYRRFCLGLLMLFLANFPNRSPDPKDAYEFTPLQKLIINFSILCVFALPAIIPVLLLVWPLLLTETWQHVRTIIQTGWPSYVAFAVCIAIGYTLYLGSKYVLLAYGIGELMIAAIAIWKGLTHREESSMFEVYAIAAGLYLAVRAFKNISDGRKKFYETFARYVKETPISQAGVV